MSDKRITDFDVVDPAVLPDNAALYTVLPTETTPALIERHFTWLGFKNWLTSFVATVVDVVANTVHRSSDGKDHSDVVLNNTHRSSDGKDHFNLLNSLKGMNHIVLTNYITTGLPAIAANSQIEINGNIYTNPSEVAISGSTANTTWYDVLLTPSGTTFTASFIARGTGVWSDSKQGLYSGNNKVVACVYRDGSGDFINKNILIINNRTIEIKIEIGAWNMDTNSTFTVAHGLPYIAPLNTIISIDGLIFGDDGASLASRILSSADISGVSYGSVDSSTVNISLSRRNAGVFDSVNYDSITQNRGILTVKYTV